jgi:Uma2 family endonuclease
MDNLAYQEEYNTELINGHIVAMSPRAIPAHNVVVNNLSRIFGNYLRGKQCICFTDVDVTLSRKDRFVPDFMVVCDRNKIKPIDGVHGAPDLVVEVLSRSTEKRDRQYKKKAYEEAGVKEYWLVSVVNHSIEMYTLIEGRLELTDVNTEIPDWELDRMSEAEKSEVVSEFSPALFPELVIPIEDVFYNVID